MYTGVLTRTRTDGNWGSSHRWAGVVLAKARPGLPHHPQSSHGQNTNKLHMTHTLIKFSLCLVSCDHTRFTLCCVLQSVPHQLNMEHRKPLKIHGIWLLQIPSFLLFFSLTFISHKAKLDKPVLKYFTFHFPPSFLYQNTGFKLTFPIFLPLAKSLCGHSQSYFPDASYRLHYLTIVQLQSLQYFSCLTLCLCFPDPRFNIPLIHVLVR